MKREKTNSCEPISTEGHAWY